MVPVPGTAGDRRGAFNLNERRETARRRWARSWKRLVGDLAVDGYHGWAEMYNTIVSHVRINYEENGVSQQFSAGQLITSCPSGSRVREEMFKLWEQEWSDKADFCADALNHIAGFRLKLYERRGWDNVLKEPLARNRMSQETLDAMWNTIVRNKPKFVQYLERKAKLLGVEKLSWCDVDAPIGGSQTTISYDDGAEAIVEQFRKFSPRMADFAVRAFENRWIEAEDRPGKRPGGFCTSLPVSNQTRIFMTYAARHPTYRRWRMNWGTVTITCDGRTAGLRPALCDECRGDGLHLRRNDRSRFGREGGEDDQEKLVLLEDKIQRSIAFYMNIHARFLFETRFYEKRKAGLVSSEQICALMEEAQQEAYCGALGSLHPHFWASKMHFYFTHVAFYNFPYTFGYLFSTGLYARALEEGESFASKYDALLRDTAVMTVEDLASKHLGIDLTKPDFWQSAINVTLKDVELFLQMTE